MTERKIDEQIDDALHEPFVGWDFSWIRDRMRETNLPWSLDSIADTLVREAESVLDMGTGGGEFLDSLHHLHGRIVALEGHRPNVAVARERLAPKRVQVLEYVGAPDNVALAASGRSTLRMPVDDGSFQLVLNRHESFDPSEVARILAPNGLFCTQQVGDGYPTMLAAMGDAHDVTAWWNLALAKQQVRSAGLRIERENEAYGVMEFLDIGALVYYLKAIPWELPGFSIERDRERLGKIGAHIQAYGSFAVKTYHFMLVASKSATTAHD